MKEVVVDGHNALHALRLRGAGVAALREQVVARVRAKAPRGATVYFDGHPAPGAFGGTEDRGVTLRYAGDREADEAIVEHVRSSRHVRRIVVVTDDLELARRVEQLGAATTRVTRFLADLTTASRDEKKGPPGLTPADFGLPETVDLSDPPADLDAPAPPRRRSPKLRRPPRF